MQPATTDQLYNTIGSPKQYQEGDPILPRILTEQETAALGAIGMANIPEALTTHYELAEFVATLSYQLGEHGNQIVRLARAEREITPAFEDMIHILHGGSTVLRSLLNPDSYWDAPLDCPRMHGFSGYSSDPNEGREVWKHPDGKVFLYDAHVAEHSRDAWLADALAQAYGLTVEDSRRAMTGPGWTEDLAAS